MNVCTLCCVCACVVGANREECFCVHVKETVIITHTHTQRLDPVAQRKKTDAPTPDDVEDKRT